MASTQPRDDNWIAVWYDMIQESKNPLKKTEIKVERIVLCYPSGILFCDTATNSVGLGSPEPQCHRFTFTFYKAQCNFVYV